MLPADIVDAGHNPPEEILAIVRPASFNSAVASMKLDQKYILKESFEMSLSIKFSASDGNDKNASHVYSNRIKPSLHKGKKPSCATYEKKVRVQALSEAVSWGLSSENSIKYRTR
nr:protein defective in meristem silencing 3 [Ipomoea batatas]